MSQSFGSEIGDGNPSEAVSFGVECQNCGTVTDAQHFCRACGHYLTTPDSKIVAAGLWRRFFANLLDQILFLALLVVGWFFWFSVTIENGQTPGKALLGVRVINEDGTAVTAGKMLVRELFYKGLIYYIISPLVILVPYVYAKAFWDKDKRTWHDQQLKTLVVTASSKPLTEIESWEKQAALRTALDRTMERLADGHDRSMIRMSLQTMGLSETDADALIERASLVAECDQLIEDNPSTATPYFDRGVLFFEIGIFDDAVEDLDRVIRIDPDHAEAYLCRGQALIKQWKADAGLVDLERAIQLRPEWAEAHWERSVELRNAGRYDEALASLQQVCDLSNDPDLIAKAERLIRGLSSQ